MHLCTYTYVTTIIQEKEATNLRLSVLACVIEEVLGEARGRKVGSTILVNKF